MTSAPIARPIARPIAGPLTGRRRGAPIDPLTLSGLVAAYRVENTARTGAAVDSWTDLSGNGHDATATGTKSQVTSTPTGEYAFGGAVYTPATAIPATFDAMTQICVFGSGRVPSYNACGINSTFALTNAAAAGGGVLFTSGTAKFYNATRNIGCLRNQSGMNCATLRFGAAESSFRSNGITHTGAANGTTITVNEFASIWGYAGAGAFLWGQEQVALYFFNRVLSDAEIAGIEEFYSVATPSSALHTIGDSFVGGTGATTAQNAYARILERATGKSLVATGGAGLTLASLNRTDLLVALNASKSAGLNPQVIFDIGKNDLAAGTTSADLQVTYAAYCADIMAAEIPLVCVTPPPRNGGFSGGADATSYETQRQLFITWLRAETTMYSALADTADHASLGEVADLAGESFVADQIHLSDTGHSQWAEVCAAALATL